jgi:hypothetical protein
MSEATSGANVAEWHPHIATLMRAKMRSRGLLKKDRDTHHDSRYKFKIATENGDMP